MSQESNPINDAAAVDKLDLHARQQLSALVDGELAPDEARFLLRRLQHDTELSGRYERWQLSGDVLRGQVRRTAAVDLSARVAAAIAAMPAAEIASSAQAVAGQRRGLLRWGGGAALAASVAAVMIMVTGREELPQPAGVPVPMVAMQTLPSTEARMATPPLQAPVVRTPQVAVASTRPAAVTTRRAPSRAAAVVAQAPTIAAVPAVAASAVAAAGAAASVDPFASAAPLHARPWPRAVLSQPSSGALTASFGEPVASRPFYPFEPGLHADAVPAAADQVDDLPAPPPEDDGR
jgi:hypothetical protein